MNLNKAQIIEAIKKLANDVTFAPAQRQADLEAIEFAAQDQREQLEARYMED